MVATPVIHYVLIVAVLLRQAPTTLECMVRAGTAFVALGMVISAPLVLRPIRLAGLVVAIVLLAAALRLLLAIVVIVAILNALGGEDPAAA